MRQRRIIAYAPALQRAELLCRRSSENPGNYFELVWSNLCRETDEGQAMKKYTNTAIVLHWLTAAAIGALFAFGLYMVSLPLSPTKLKFFAWHKWAGCTIFLLALGRIAWRLSHLPPPLPRHMSAEEEFFSQAGHGILYFLMVAIPLSGWLMSSAKGVQTVLFGVLPIPDLLFRDRTLGEALQSLHWGLNMTLASIVAGHALLALKHHFIDRDDVLTRMLPGGGRR